MGAIVRRQSARVVQRAWRSARETRDAARAFLRLGLVNDDDEGVGERGTGGDAATAAAFASFSSLLVSKRAREATREWLARVEDMTRSTPLDVTTLACLQALSPRACASGKCERFPVRLMLSAYMIVRHPDVVLGGAGPTGENAPEEEEALKRSAESFVKCMNDVAMRCAEAVRYCTETTALEESWSSFVERFTRWKMLDACALEQELIRIGVAMTASMLRVCGLNPSEDLDDERKAIREAQARDVELLRSKIATLTGDVGVTKFDEMISAVHERAEEADAFARAEDVDHIVGDYTCSESASAAETLEHRRRAREATSELTREAIHRDKCLAAKQHEEDYMVDVECERMFHEVLINPSWRPEERKVGSGEDEDLYQSVQTAVHEAFWDNMYQSLVQKPADMDLLNAQVHEFRDRVLDAAANVGAKENVLSKIREHLLAMDAHILNDVIATMRDEPEKAITTLRVMLLAGHSALQCLVDPITGASIESRYHALLKNLDEITKLDDDACEDCGNTIARAVVAALSFLLPACEEVCLKSVQNMLDLIRPAASCEDGPLFAREKFMRRHGIDSERVACDKLSATLPATRDWIANVSSQRVNRMDAELTPLLNALTNSVKLRSGFNQVSGASSEAKTKVIPTRVCSMDGVVRLAFVATITARGMNSWPETLLFDQDRLFDLQNDFQLVHVLSACCVLCKQLDPGVKDIEKLISRCSAHLRHEQGRLSDIAKEIKLISPSITDTEDTIVCMLRRLTECGDADDRTASAKELSSVNSMSTTIFDSLRAALSIRLLLGFEDDKVTRLVHTKLAKIGSTALRKHVDDIARQVWHVCSVSLKIHAPFYHTFAHELILCDEDEI